jgi:outer membrane autotransporter protein
MWSANGKTQICGAILSGITWNLLVSVQSATQAPSPATLTKIIQKCYSLERANLVSHSVMRNHRRLRLTRHFPIFFAGAAFIFLGYGVIPTHAQDFTWNGITAGDNNWFVPSNWDGSAQTIPPVLPSPTQSAGVDTGPPAVQSANIATPGAVANELLIGGAIVTEVTVAGITIDPLEPSGTGQVIVNGATASLTLFGTGLATALPAGQVSLDVVSGSLLVENGATLTSSGSGVGRFADANTAPTVTVTGSGSTWIENGTLEIGSGNTSTVTVSDGASFRGAGTVTIASLGTLKIGIGGLSGTFNAPSIVNDGLINFNFTDSTTLGAQVSGTGEIEKFGSGTLTLTGTNSYSGETFIDGGTLVAAATNALGTGDVSVSGPTSVLRISPGTLEANFFTVSDGATLDNAGTLQLPAVTDEPTALITVNGDGTITNEVTGSINATGLIAIQGFTAVDPVTVTNAGVISGTIAILFTDVDGTITNASTGTITGTSGTAIEATGGAVTLSNAGVIHGNVTLDDFPNAVTLFTGSQIVGNLNLGSPTAASLILDGSGTQLLSQAVTGTVTNFNTLTKQGTGTWTIDEALTYTGATTVNAGSLIVNGSIASAQTLVNAGGLLGGLGSIGGPLGSSLVNSGIVSPGSGDTPGTLTVNSNYTQNADGTLRIGIAPTQHDLLAVNGHASLAGTLQLISLGSFTLHVGDQVTILTAGGGVSGTFGTVQNQIATGTLVKAQVVYLPDGVVFEGTQGSFVEAACNPNSAAVARALDSAVGDPRASTLIAFLDNEPLNKLCSDFTLIAPEELASIFDIGVSLANVQTANLKRRMEDIHLGSTGFSAAGFTLNGNAPSGGGFAGVSGPEGKGGPSVMTPTPENRWGVWVTGIGEFTNVDSTNDAAGYYLETGGLTLGVDYRVSSYFAVGLTAGYAHTDADLANGGNLDVNAGNLGLYATVFGSGFYLDTAITGGPSGYDTQRTALLGTASGSTDGGNFNVLVAAGYDWKKGDLSIGPTANFQLTYVGLDSFSESGSLAPLKFPAQNSESERTAFGMRASYDWKVGRVIIKPEISLAWQHEYGDQAYSIVSSFANGAGNSFTVNGPSVGRDSLLIGAGAAVLLSERVSIYAYYDGELCRTNYDSNNVSAGVRVTF